MSLANVIVILISGGFAAMAPVVVCLISIVKMMAGIKENKAVTVQVSHQVEEVHSTLNSRLSEFLDESRKQNVQLQDAMAAKLRAEFDTIIAAKDSAYLIRIEHLENQLGEHNITVKPEPEKPAPLPLPLPLPIPAGPLTE